MKIIDNFNFYILISLSVIFTLSLLYKNHERVFDVFFFATIIMIFAILVFVREYKKNKYTLTHLYDYIIITILALLLSYITYLFSLTAVGFGGGGYCHEGISLVFDIAGKFLSLLLLVIAISAFIGLFTYKREKFQKIIAIIIAILLAMSFFVPIYYWVEVTINPPNCVEFDTDTLKVPSALPVPH